MDPWDQNSIQIQRCHCNFMQHQLSPYVTVINSLGIITWTSSGRADGTFGSLELLDSFLLYITADLQMGAELPYLTGSGLHFQGHGINKLQSLPFCCQYLSSRSLIPADVPPEIHVISHTYPTDLPQISARCDTFSPPWQDDRPVSQPAVCGSGGRVTAWGRGGGCSTETHIYTHKRKLRQQTDPDSQPPR